MLAVMASALMVTGALSQEGPRAYFLLPEDSDIISLTGNLLDGKVGGTEFGAATMTPSYRRSIEVGGNAGALLIGIPLGSASVDFGVGTVETDLAQGDLFVGGELGLVGSPSLAVMDYVQYKPGFRASVAAKLFLPTGDYDSSRFANLGRNRWSLLASLPISYVLADSMVDPAITTFEIVPSVQIFGDNDDPLFGETRSKEPIWALEGHITRNFGLSVWGALDAFYKVSATNGDTQDSLSLGATLGLVLSPTVALRLSYLEQVYSSEPDSASRGLELTTAFRF